MARNQGLSFYRRKNKEGLYILREIFSWTAGIAAAVLLAAALNYCLGLSTHVVGSSMEPTLVSGQRIFISRISYLFHGPEAGDVILFLPNGNRNSHYYVKRVAAGPGDKLQILGGTLYVNGKASEWFDELEDPGIASNEMILGKNEYFCIGDAPESSEDSRSADIGPVHSEDIVGKVWFRLEEQDSGMGFVK